MSTLVSTYFYAFGSIFLSANIQATDVKGTLFFKKISDLSKGKYASYNNDRIVFYENDYTGKDFVAYVCFSLPYPSLFELRIDILSTP